jgi:hypothetical protein
MTTFIVTTFVDENGTGADLSLREALALANANPDEDIINFAAALAGQTIVLDPLLSQLTITQSVTIDGDISSSGTADITVDADGNSRVFEINDGAATTITAALNGLVITGGNAGGAGNGGGILVGENDALLLSNATVSDNTSSVSGGGIWTGEGAALTLT